MSDTVKVNAGTGQVAVMRGGAWHIFSPGMYKVNAQTGQIALPDVKANGYEIHDAPDAVSKLSSPDAILARQTGGVQVAPPAPDPNQFKAALQPPGQAAPAPNDMIMGQGESALRGAQQGITLGTADEIGGAAGGLVRAALGDQAPIDPAHPVTGGMSGGFVPNYLASVGQERALNAAAQASNPKTYKGARLAGSALPAMAINPASMAGTVATGAAQGGIMGAGFSDANDWGKALTSGAIGAGLGGASAGAARGLFNAAFNNNTGAGLAYKTVQATSPDEAFPSIIRRTVQPGLAPAELDAVMADVLKSQAARNPSAAVAAVPVAQGQMQRANDIAVQGVNQMVSPENAALLEQQIQQQAQAANGPAYAAAHASPVRVGLPYDITQRPSFQEALAAANARATDEMPPRHIDPTDLSALDLDLIDRALQRAQRAATETRGDTSQAAQIAQARIPTRGEVAATVRQVADQAFPELATARQQAAHSFSVQEALTAGGTALNPSREALDVATEFSALGPQQQQAYRAGVATKLRSMLATKTANANVGQVFDRTGLADKLEAIGFPRPAIDQIVEGGAGARRVLDALQGGSDTARKLIAAKAGESGISQLKPSDLITGSVMGGDPITKGTISAALPILRAAGSNAERNAAGTVIRALTGPGGHDLVSLYNQAPQTWGGLTTGAPAAVGGLSAATFAQALHPYTDNLSARTKALARELLNSAQQ